MSRKNNPPMDAAGILAALEEIQNELGPGYRITLSIVPGSYSSIEGRPVEISVHHESYHFGDDYGDRFDLSRSTFGEALKVARAKAKKISRRDSKYALEIAARRIIAEAARDGMKLADAAGFIKDEAYRSMAIDRAYGIMPSLMLLADHEKAIDDIPF